MDGGVNSTASTLGDGRCDADKDNGELFLQEIEAVDDYWGPTFRAIYESESQSEAFLERLREAKDKSEFDQFMEERAAAAKSED